MISWQHYLIKRSKLKHFDKEGSICPLCKERWDTIFEIIMCLLSILTKHGQKQWKTFENHEKSSSSIMRTRGSCKAHEEKRKKKFVGQRLGVTPKSWLTWFSNVFIVFDHANAWASMHLLVEIHNTYRLKKLLFLVYLWFILYWQQENVCLLCVVNNQINIHVTDSNKCHLKPQKN